MHMKEMVSIKMDLILTFQSAAAFQKLFSVAVGKNAKIHEANKKELCPLQVKVDQKTKEASNHSEGIIHHVTAQSKIKKLP